MKELQHIYRKRKKQLLPLAFGLASFFVIFRVIMPQWSDIQSVQELLTTKSSAITAKEESVLVLNSISDQVVDENYNTSIRALPLQKDAILIYTELTGAAAQANVKLGGFSIKVGGIYSTIKSSPSKDRIISGIPSLNILVNVSGQNENLRKYAEILYKSVPLVEIKNVDISKSDARLDVNFYYQPVAIKSNNSDNTAIKKLTTAEVTQLQTLKSWQNATPSQ